MATDHGAPTPEQFAALAKTLAEAMERHADAQRVESEARSRETSALNAVNDAQKAVDAAVAKLRHAADMSSSWGQERRFPPVRTVAG